MKGLYDPDAQQPLWPEVVAKGFVVQAKRWIVERTHAWNERAPPHGTPRSINLGTRRWV